MPGLAIFTIKESLLEDDADEHAQAEKRLVSAAQTTANHRETGGHPACTWLIRTATTRLHTAQENCIGRRFVYSQCKSICTQCIFACTAPIGRIFPVLFRPSAEIS